MWVVKEGRNFWMSLFTDEFEHLVLGAQLLHNSRQISEHPIFILH